MVVGQGESCPRLSNSGQVWTSGVLPFRRIPFCRIRFQKPVSPNPVSPESAKREATGQATIGYIAG